jgi:phage terminase small subunit
MRSPRSGRKPLPASEKVARGTNQPCRRQAAVDLIDMGPPADVAPPSDLPMGAREVWADHAPALIAKGWLTPVDVVAFGQWCVMTHQLMSAWSADGSEDNPLPSASYIQQWRTLGEAFYITPGARASVRPAAPDRQPTGNAFARNGRRG